MAEHKPISTPEMLQMRGPAYTTARVAMAMRARANELLQEANQIFADAEQLELAARALPDEEDEDGMPF